MSIAVCETDHIYYAYPLSSLMFPPGFTIYASLATLVQFLIVIPFHQILALYFVENGVLKLASTKGRQIDDTEKSSVKKPDEPSEFSASTSGTAQILNPEPLLGTPEVKKPKYSRKILIFFSFVNQFTIFALLGIIWSAIGKTFPEFLDTYIGRLEMGTYAAGLFCNGVVMWYHPFKGAPVLDLIFSIICHFCISPVLSGAFSVLLKQDKNITKYLLFANIAPTSIYGYQLSQNLMFGDSVISYTLYWTSFLILPVNLILTAILNLTKLFD